MSESPKRPMDAASAEVSRVAKPIRSPGSPSTETARAADSVPAPGGPFATLPMQFGRYEIRRELGRGQMGAVYLAQDVELDRLVALKVARTSASGSAKLLKRMEIEAKSAAKVDHPLICKVYDAGEIDGIRFIALQYIEGEDLKQYMKRLGRRREPHEAVRLILQILGALEAAHEKGVIHRDLKPENVMLNAKREPVIMDFGLARRTIASSDAGLTQGMIVGTAAYMSPEQATGKAEGIDHRSDLYAVGVMLFEMLTGEWPFTGGAIEVMGKKCVQEPPSPLTLSPSLNPQLATICHKMIAKQKGDRYVTCAEVIEVLEAIDLNAPTAIKAPAIAADPSPELDLPNEPSAALAPRKISKTGSKKKNLRRKTSSKALMLLTQFWDCMTPAVRWTVIGGAVVCSLVLFAILFFPTSHGVLRIDIEDPTLSVKFDGSTITVENDGHPLRVTPTVNHTLAVLQNGVEIESATREIALKKGDRRTVKVQLLEGAVVIDGEPIIPKTNTSKRGNPPTPEPSFNSNPATVATSVKSSSIGTENSDDVAIQKSELDRIATGSWIRLVDSKTALTDPQKMKFQNGILELDNTNLEFPKVNAQDVILRAQVCKVSGQNVGLWIRASGTESLSAWFNGSNWHGGDFFGVVKFGEGKFVSLGDRHIGRKIQPDQFVEMAFAAIGDTLTLYVDGTKIITSKNQVTRGFIFLSAFNGKSLFKDVEYQILDPIPLGRPE